MSLQKKTLIDKSQLAHFFKRAFSGVLGDSDKSHCWLSRNRNKSLENKTCFKNFDSNRARVLPSRLLAIRNVILLLSIDDKSKEESMTCGKNSKTRLG